MPMSHKERIIVPKKPPYEMAEDYIASKAATRDIIKPYISGDDVSENTVNISNYMARYELCRTETLLRTKRNIAMDKRKELDEQWIDLQKKEDNLREMFVSFNGFVMDNRDKRTRAADRISELESVHMRRDKHIAELTHKCCELQKVKEEMNEKIMVYKLFENFLNITVEQYPEDFENVLDILNRYEVIKHTSQELIEQHERELDRVNQIKKDCAKTVDGYMVTVAGLRTRVARLSLRHDAAQRECRRWEEVLGRVGDEASRRVADLVAIRDSCERLSREARQRRGRREARGAEAQLGVIKRALRDYGRINEMARRAREEELVASGAARASKESV